MFFLGLLFSSHSKSSSKVLVTCTSLTKILTKKKRGNPMKLKYFLFLLLTLTNTQYTLSIATVRYVSKTGTSTPPYASWQTAADSIQKCINICSFGDTVYVANGVYKETLVINTAISLIGSSMDSTVIDGTGLGNYTISTSTYNSNGSIENFNIYGKGENAEIAWVLSLQNNSFKVKNCQLRQAALGIGADADIIAENLILKNLRVRGLSLYGSNNNIVSNCLFIFNNENAEGIEIGFAPNGIYHITNNIIILTDTNGTGSAEGIVTGAPGKVYIYNNLISGFFPVHIALGNNVQDTAFIKNNVLLYQASNGPASIDAAASRTI